MAKTEKILENLYMNPRKPSSLGGVERLYKAAKLVIPQLRRTEVERFLQGKLSYSQHKQTKRKFTRRPVIATDKFDVFQMDLTDKQKFGEHNDGFKCFGSS